MFKVGQLNGCICINEYIGPEENAFCEVPGIIEGMPVTAVGRFAFSEKRQLREVCLPKTVESIGAHAFYNCRGLESVTIYDSAVDIGDGAFKNCYNVNRITIIRNNNNSRCLKGILSEVNHEVTVDMQYSDGVARLIFPYYLDDYEENTPARIITQVTAGSGVRYRECITGEDVNYAEYDRIFLQAMHIDVLDSAMKIAMARVRFPYKLQEDAKKQYDTYLFDNRISWVLKLLKEEQYKDLEEVLSMGILDCDDLMYCIEQARQNSYMEGLGILLAYQKENYGVTKKAYEF